MAPAATADRKGITRRLFLIFIGFALLPVLTLSLVAVQYVNSTSQAQIQRILASEADALSEIVVARLNAASRRLALYAQQLRQDDSPDQFGIAEVPGETPLRFQVVDSDFLGDGATSDALSHLERGRALVTVRPGADGVERVYMLRAIDIDRPTDGLVATRIGATYALGTPETRNLTVDNCIYDIRGRALFASNAELCRQFGGFDGAHRDSQRAAWQGKDYHLNYRSIFMRENYRTDDWLAGVVTADASVLQASRTFRGTFLAFAALALLTLSLLSIRLIRRQMAPLEPIMAGIDRVARHQYDEVVEVNSGDEFEAMADAFNNMARRVSQQLTTMSSLSEIDRLILSRGKKEDVLRIVLEKTRLVLPGDVFAILLPDAERHDSARIYRLGNDGHGALYSIPAALDELQRQALADGGTPIVGEGMATPPGFLAGLADDGCARHQLVPVATDERLVAVLIIGFSTAQLPDEEAIALAVTYADRVAVALANAEWEEKLYLQAHYDTLTGLPNRPALIDALRQRITLARREKTNFGVLFIDLDNFKLINDSLGHDYGDKLIAAIGERLEDCLRDNDMVARLGGDEFIILASESTSHSLTTASMNGIAHRIMSAVQKPIVIDGNEIRATASIGIAICPRDGVDATSLMKHADMAMYHAKASGPSQFHFYSDELNAEAMELMELSTELKRALERDEFVLHYQPKVCAETRVITGAEALLRWQHPTRGLLTPARFIAAAESLGLIGALSDRALESVCRQLRLWKDAGEPTVPVSVNVTTGQIQHEDIESRIAELLEQHALEGSELELEITERVLVRHVEATIRILESIRGLGVAISIDDYGTGYSSLSYMKHLPVDKLKIDKSFITELETDAADQAIVSSAILLARRLNLSIVAEGVETSGQLALLQEFGCNEIQGYHFSPAVPADKMAELLRTGAFAGTPPASTQVGGL